MSLTIFGLIVLVLGKLAQTIGWNGSTVTEEQLQSIVHAVGVLMQIYGLLAAAWGRYRHGDLTWAGFYKSVTNPPAIDQLPDDSQQ